MSWAHCPEFSYRVYETIWGIPSVEATLAESPKFIAAIACLSVFSKSNLVAAPCDALCRCDTS